jgi:TIR domain
MASVFVSYAHEDSVFARELAHELSLRGTDVWIDYVELLVGDSMIERVAEAIAEEDFVLAIVSPDSAQSGWCRRELSLAATRGISEKRVFVLPVRYREANMPESIRDLRWLDADALQVADVANKLVSDIEQHLGRATKAHNAWLETALAVYNADSESSRECWLHHLEGAEIAGRRLVKVESGPHYHAAGALRRLGALTELPHPGSYAAFEITQRGRTLLATLRTVMLN